MMRSHLQVTQSSASLTPILAAGSFVAPGTTAAPVNRAAIGPCAAIVNGTGRDVTVSSAWLHQTYGHVVAPIGGDIPGGGRVSLTGTRFYVNHTYIAPARGMLIVR